jgi:DNA-binding PadR family transcriptional regulator
MREWEIAARVLEALGEAERERDTEMSGPRIGERAGWGPRSTRVYGGLDVLEAKGFVEGRWEPPVTLPGFPRRFYSLADKARRPDEVLDLLFRPTMGASHMTLAIIAELRHGAREEGWVSGRMLATALRVRPRRTFGWRRRQMQSALDRLDATGLIESRQTRDATPGPWRNDYRLAVKPPGL